MAGARAAIRYAKAILSLANDQNTAEAVNNDMKLVVNTVAESKDLSNMLTSAVVNPSVKKAALLEIFKGTNALVTNAIDTLVANKRVSIFNDVAQQYSILFDAQKGTQVATVTTALALTDELKTKVLAKVKELTGKEAELENIIDESILGGFVLRIGDLQYNASIASQLSKLKREFTLN